MVSNSGSDASGFELHPKEFSKDGRNSNGSSRWTMKASFCFRLGWLTARFQRMTPTIALVVGAGYAD